MHKDILFVVLAYKHKFITLGTFSSIGSQWKSNPSVNIFRLLLEKLSPQKFDKLREIFLETEKKYGTDPEKVIKTIGGMGIVQRNFGKWDELHRISEENWGGETIIDEDDNFEEMRNSIIDEFYHTVPPDDNSLNDLDVESDQPQLSGEFKVNKTYNSSDDEFEDETININIGSGVQPVPGNEDETRNFILKKSQNEISDSMMEETLDIKPNKVIESSEENETRNFILKKNSPPKPPAPIKNPYLSQSTSRGEIVVKDYNLQRIDRKPLIEIKERPSNSSPFEPEMVHKPSNFSMLLDDIDKSINIPEPDAFIEDKNINPPAVIKNQFAAPLPPPPPGYSPAADKFSGSGLFKMGISSEEEGRYDIKGEKYRGSIGKILIGVDRYIGREIAIKELLPTSMLPSGSGSFDQNRISPSNSANIRFLREARLAGQLQHPSIIPIYEIGKRKDGSYYYTMRHVRGKTFGDAIFQAKTLQKRLLLLPHFLDLCNAISYAHSKGVIHRDLKPENVMIGEFGETVVLDWGLAKLKTGEDIGGEMIAKEIRRLTQGDVHTVAGQALGTPAYMPPEQAKGEIHLIDKQSDIYSLGAVLYEILVGSPPFSGNLYDVIHKVVHENPPLIHKIQPSVPRKLASISQKCLNKEKRYRYSDVSEMVKDIESYMAGEKVSGFGSSSLQFVKNLATSGKKIIAYGTGVLILLLVLLFGSVIQWRNSLNKIESMHDSIEDASKKKLMAHYHIAQAFNELASRMERDGRFLGSQIYAASSLIHNPANKKSKYFVKDFEKTHLGSNRLKVEAESKIFKTELSLSLKLVKIKEFRSSLVKLAVSHVSNIIAISFYNNIIELIDLDGNKKSITLNGHTDKVTGLGFSPDGEQIVSVSYDKTVRIWSVKTGKLLHTLTGHTDRIVDVTWSPDGSNLASLDYSGVIILWDLNKGAGRLQINYKRRYKIFKIKYSPDSKLLIAGARDNNVIVYDSLKGNVIKRIKGFFQRINSIAISPDNTKVVACGDSNSIAIWDLRKRRLIRSLQGHTGTVKDVSISPDGKYIYSGSVDKTIKVWDMNTGGNLFTILAHKERVVGISYLSDNIHLVSASWDNTIKMWKLKRPQILPHLVGHTDYIVQAEYSPNGKFIASSSWDRTVKTWNSSTGKRLLNFSGYNDNVYGISWSPNGKRLASSCWDGTITILDTLSGRSIKLSGHKDRVFGLAWSIDGSYLISTSKDKTAIMWDVNWAKPLHILRKHKNTVRNVAVSKKGRKFATVSDDKTIIIWDMNGQEIKTLKGHKSSIYGADFSSDGKMLVTSTINGNVWLWDVSTGKVILKFIGHTARVNAVKFSSDDMFIATASDDHTVRVWNVKTGHHVMVLKTSRESLTVDFSPNGKDLLYGDGNEIKMVPLDFSISKKDPLIILKNAEKSSGLKLNGFLIGVNDDPLEESLKK